MYDVYIAAVNIVVTVMIYNRCNQLCIHVYGLFGVCSMFTHGGIYGRVECVCGIYGTVVYV